MDKNKMTTEFFKKLSETNPYITVINYSGNEYVGIIQNRDEFVTTFYDYGSIVSDEIKKEFLKLADDWWWNSNRTIPIHLFLKDDWAPFRAILKTFTNKNLTILHGPTTSMRHFSRKKTKKKTIQIKLSESTA
jgi:hypothetical protein